MNNKRPFPAIGGSSLLVIFSVLTLTIFALLGLSTVQADSRLAEASSQSVTAYYQANLQAHQILAQLRNGELVDNVEISGNSYRYHCPISDTQALFVTVELDGNTFTIQRWQAASTSDWIPDDSLPVWDGTF